MITLPERVEAVAKTNLALQFGKWGSNGKLRFSNRVLAVADFADASRKWETIRDRENWGASESPVVCVVDTETGERIAKVSYNGRVWGEDGKEIVL